MNAVRRPLCAALTGLVICGVIPAAWSQTSKSKRVPVERSAQRPALPEGPGDLSAQAITGTCDGGPFAGMPCGLDTDCGQCVVGTASCAMDADCPDVCSDGSPCVSDCDCGCICVPGDPAPRSPFGGNECGCEPDEVAECNETCQGDTCSAGTCVFEVCGDGVITGAEGCDDGNTAPGDGCSDLCQEEPGYLCVSEPSDCADIDECAQGSPCDPNAACTNTPGAFECMCLDGYVGDGFTCVELLCGNGVVDPGEDCDPGPDNPFDCCTVSCTYAAAGANCGGLLQSQCQGPSTCDDAGTCQPNFWPEGTPCAVETCDCAPEQLCALDVPDQCPAGQECFSLLLMHDVTAAEIMPEAEGVCRYPCTLDMPCPEVPDCPLTCSSGMYVVDPIAPGPIGPVPLGGYCIQAPILEPCVSLACTAEGCCAGTLLEPPVNDLCADAVPVLDGDTPFSTICTTTDGPAHQECQFDGQTYSDIWYRYTASCTGDLTASTCNQADYDTDLVIYDSTDCGDLVRLGCNDDAANCTGFTSELTVPVVAGNQYLVRVGGFNANDDGTGVLTITPNMCPEGACCQCGEVCTLETAAGCDALGGTYLGDGTSCTADAGVACHLCGNGVVECDEQCDDGNMLDFDTCSNSCMSQPDSDGDGVADPFDQCPDNGARVCVGSCGCAYDGSVAADPLIVQPCVQDIDTFCDALGVNYDVDTDHDGTYDCHDHCPLDVTKTQPGICGCQWPDVDTDGDGTYDCPCPGLPSPCTPGGDDCAGGDCVECAPAGGEAGFGATCTAGDYVCIIEGTCGDFCPTDANLLYPGACGCHTGPGDGDGDGTPDCDDGCPLDPDKVDPGVCGCGFGDTGDADADGVLDCVDVCPEDPGKALSPGLCGCGEIETPPGGYTVGGFVHIPLRAAGDALDGIPYIDVQLTCEGIDPLYAATQLTTTCVEPDHTGLFVFDGVACGTCHLSFRYKDTCGDRFDVAACGQSVTVGAGEWISFEVDAAAAGGMAPCLQSIDVVATNDSYDILMRNAACHVEPAAPCFDHIGRPAASLSESLLRLAGCFFSGACCGPAEASELGPVTDCKCAYDCNNDGIFSVVSDLWCWTHCLVNGACHPDDCGDGPLPPGVAAAGRSGLTVGGIVFSDADHPLTSGVEGILVEVVDAAGRVHSARTNRIGVWAAGPLSDGQHTVRYARGAATVTIAVTADDLEANQSLHWQLTADRTSRR